MSMKRKRCPNEACRHAEYVDSSDKTFEAQPYCPACMRTLKSATAPTYTDGSDEQQEASY